MILLDSSVWIEYFSDGPLSDKLAVYVQDPENILTPTIVLYEVYKKARLNFPEKFAIEAVGQLKRTFVVPLTDNIALAAVDISLKHSLAMADAIIYATAVEYGCKVVTSDAHFENLENVVYIKKA